MIFLLVNQQISIAFVIGSFIPIPHVNSGVIKLHPSSLAFNDRVIVASFWTSNMNHKSFEHIDLTLLAFDVEVGWEVDFIWKFNGMIEFDFVHGL